MNCSGLLPVAGFGIGRCWSFYSAKLTHRGISYLLYACGTRYVGVLSRILCGDTKSAARDGQENTLLLGM